jgi:hypothetical protein
MSEIIIEAGRTEKNYWADLWRYRELFLILAWRDHPCATSRLSPEFNQLYACVRRGMVGMNDLTSCFTFSPTDSLATFKSYDV